MAKEASTSERHVDSFYLQPQQSITSCWIHCNKVGSHTTRHLWDIVWEVSCSCRHGSRQVSPRSRLDFVACGACDVWSRPRQRRCSGCIATHHECTGPFILEIPWHLHALRRYSRLVNFFLWRTWRWCMRFLKLSWSMLSCLIHCRQPRIRTTLNCWAFVFLRHSFISLTVQVVLWWACLEILRGVLPFWCRTCQIRRAWFIAANLALKRTRIHEIVYLYVSFYLSTHEVALWWPYVENNGGGACGFRCPTSQIRRAWFIAAKYTVTGPRIHEILTRTCRDLHTYMSLLTHKSHTHTPVSAVVVRRRVCGVPAWTWIRTWIRNLCVKPYS